MEPAVQRAEARLSQGPSLPPSSAATAVAARVRWWPAMLVAVLTGLALVVTILRIIPLRSQQHVNLQVAQILILSILALLVWVLFFSRLRWRVRWAVLGGLIGVIGLLSATFRIRGVTGNLVPILEPRWAHRRLETVVSGPAVSAAAAVPGGADFPQFLGPNRDGTLAGPALATNWTAHPPALLWRHPLGAAWSGFAVVGALAITQEQRGEEEAVVAYELPTGRALWSHADRARYFTTLAGEGPRATPTIVGQRVFAQGATGLLNCLDLVTGRVVWSKDIFKDNQGGMPEWGHSSSPLVLGDVVIVNPGGRRERSLVAYAVSDGAFVWSGGKHGASYSSPAVATLDGVKQIVLFAGSLEGYDAATGQPLWQLPWPGGHPHIAMPIIVSGTDVVVSSGYGTGSGRIRIRREAGAWSARPVWRTNRMKAKFTNLVLHRGHLYGFDDGIMACLDAETGELKWKDGRYGHGQVLLVGELLLALAENGDMLLLDPRPDGLHELTHFSALTGKTWNPPALAGEYLLVRNDKEAACFRLPVLKQDR